MSILYGRSRAACADCGFVEDLGNKRCACCERYYCYTHYDQHQLRVSPDAASLRIYLDTIIQSAQILRRWENQLEDLTSHMDLAAEKAWYDLNASHQALSDLLFPETKQTIVDADPASEQQMRTGVPRDQLIVFSWKGEQPVEARWKCQECGESFRERIDVKRQVWLADNPRELKHVCAACHKRLTREKKIIREAK